MSTNTKIIAVGNQKGGVTKTTTTVSLGHYFALQGKRVLIIDLDPQGHAGKALGVGKGDGLFRWIVQKQPTQEAAINARPNLDVITNDHTNEMVVLFIQAARGREYLMANALEDAPYDLVFLDMPPSTNVLHILSLVASDYLLIPTLMDFLAVDSVMEILKTNSSLAEIPSVTPPGMLGILPAQYERTTRETQIILSKLAQAIGQQYILPPVPEDTKIREAAHNGKTIWEYAPRSRSAVGYENGAKAQNSQGLTGGYLHTAEIIERIIKKQEGA